MYVIPPSPPIPHEAILETAHVKTAGDGRRTIGHGETACPALSPEKISPEIHRDRQGRLVLFKGAPLTASNCSGMLWGNAVHATE